MPQTTISTPEQAAAITRMTLGITTARGDAAPSVGLALLYGACSASEDE